MIENRFHVLSRQIKRRVEGRDSVRIAVAKKKKNHAPARSRLLCTSRHRKVTAARGIYYARGTYAREKLEI